MAFNRNLKSLIFIAAFTFTSTTYGKQERAATTEPAQTKLATPPPSPAESNAELKSEFNMEELDKSLDICQDLNSFVNAKWVAANPIPNDRTSWGTIDQLVDKSVSVQHEIVVNANINAAQATPGSIEQKIGWFYRAGMNQDSINRAGFDPIKPKLNAIAKLRDGADIANFIYNSFKNGDQQVFKFESGADLKDAQKQIGFASQGGLGLPTPDYYSDPKYADIREAYANYIIKSLQLAGASEAVAKQQAADVLAFETELAKASLSPSELRKLENLYHIVTVEEANEVTPHFSWDSYFTALDLSAINSFSLAQPKFFAQFDKLLAQAPITQWQAYLRFHTIDDASPFLSSTFQNNRFNFYGKTLSGQLEQMPRWKQVLGTINASMGEALGQLYVAKEFPPEAKKRAEELAANIRDAMKNRIQNVDWMSNATKKKALEKWSKLLPKIGYPEHWRTWDDLHISPDNYYENVISSAKLNYQHDISHIGKQTDRTEWHMAPQMVNASYSRSTNTINFPAAILQPPFFYSHGSDAINYGAIGALIGHEITHGFDDRGRQFDGDGNKANWWTPEDETQFKVRAAKLIAQFNSYEPIKGKPNLHVNGELTLGENIADLGGLNIAYDALQTALKHNPAEAKKKVGGYSADQIFFLSSARMWRNNIRDKSAELLLNVDPHAPTSLRAIGAPSNMSTFSEAFQCKPTDPMIRSGDKQIKIW